MRFCDTFLKSIIDTIFFFYCKMETTDYAQCGGISIALAILPTVGLLVSELLPYLHKSDKCNGILQTILCGIKHLINKEPCSAEEITEAIARITPLNSPRTNNLNAGDTPANSPV